jgi:hypothetical protein
MSDNWKTKPSTAQAAAREWLHKVRSVVSLTPSPGEQQQEPEPEVPTTAPGSALYQHTAPTYQPRNVNRVHQKELQESGFNTRLAVWLTKNVGTMQCAYLFAGIGIGSLVGVATNNVVLAAIFGSLSSYFLQLVLLPILSVGQNVLGRRQELQADEMFKTSQRSFHDIQEIMAHLSAQDEEILKQTRLLLKLAGEPGEEAVPIEPAAKPVTGKQPPAPVRRDRRPTGSTSGG